MQLVAVLQVYLPPKSPERRWMGALRGRTKLGVVLVYGTQSHSYVVFTDGVVHVYRSFYRLPLSKRWSGEQFRGATITRKDQHHPRGGRAIPFVPSDEVREYDGVSRALKRLELRQTDFDI